MHADTVNCPVVPQMNVAHARAPAGVPLGAANVQGLPGAVWLYFAFGSVDGCMARAESSSLPWKKCGKSLGVADSAHKRLEFDHAVILDVEALDERKRPGNGAKNLYVAMTRPSRSLTVLSSSLMFGWRHLSWNVHPSRIAPVEDAATVRSPTFDARVQETC